MRKSILIFGIITIAILSLSAQVTFKTDSNKVQIEEQSANELYNSIYSDFENYYMSNTLLEENEDAEMLEIYNELNDEFNIIEQTVLESEEDLSNNELFASIVNDINKK